MRLASLGMVTFSYNLQQAAELNPRHVLTATERQREQSMHGKQRVKWEQAPFTTT
jgi:hypothetical protein